MSSTGVNTQNPGHRVSERDVSTTTQKVTIYYTVTFGGFQQATV